MEHVSIEHLELGPSTASFESAARTFISKYEAVTGEIGLAYIVCQPVVPAILPLQKA